MSAYTIKPDSDARATPKRIALIRRDTPARLFDSNHELATTAPHLLLREIILIEAGLALLAVLSLVFDAPLEGIADPYHTPNPAKAPWYFLGLQELLHFFPPVVAGVLLPALAVLALVVIPYFRINTEVVGLYERPWRRTLAILSGVVLALAAVLAVYRAWPILAPTLGIYVLLALPSLPGCPVAWRARLGRVPLADWIMLWFVALAVTLTSIGLLFRGPGWAWSWPWEGIYG